MEARLNPQVFQARTSQGHSLAESDIHLSLLSISAARVCLARMLSVCVRLVCARRFFLTRDPAIT